MKALVAIIQEASIRQSCRALNGIKGALPGGAAFGCELVVKMIANVDRQLAGIEPTSLDANPHLKEAVDEALGLRAEIMALHNVKESQVEAYAREKASSFQLLEE